MMLILGVQKNTFQKLAATAKREPTGRGGGKSSGVGSVGAEAAWDKGPPHPVASLSPAGKAGRQLAESQPNTPNRAEQGTSEAGVRSLITSPAKVSSLLKF